MRALPSRFVRDIYFPLAQRYKGERLIQYLQALRRDSALSTDELRARQWHDLQTLVREARKAPFWAARLRDFPDPISPADYARLPILTKDDLRNMAMNC